MGGGGGGGEIAQSSQHERVVEYQNYSPLQPEICLIRVKIWIKYR